MTVIFGGVTPLSINNPASYCKDAYASVRRDMDMVANVDSSDYICRRVDVMVRLSLEI